MVKCGPKGKGYYFNTSLPWVKEALPILKVGLMLLQVELSASGVPFPLAAGSNYVFEKPDMHSFLKSAERLLQGNISPDSLGWDLDSALAEKEVAAAIRGLQAEGRMMGNIRHAYNKVVCSLLKEVDPNLLYLGLVKVISSSGRVGWVKDDPTIIQKFIDNN